MLVDLTPHVAGLMRASATHKGGRGSPGQARWWRLSGSVLSL